MTSPSSLRASRSIQKPASDTSVRDTSTRKPDGSSRVIQFPAYVLRPGTQNLYAHTADNPLNWRDPRGLQGEGELEEGAKFLSDEGPKLIAEGAKLAEGAEEAVSRSGGTHRAPSSWRCAGKDGAVSALESASYCGYRYPAEIISHAVWLYFRFSLSLRDVEELLAERGVTVTYDTIEAWCAKFGPSYAAELRRRRARLSDKWHLDEVQLKIKGERHWLWRAVDKHGVVLDILIQQRRDQCAAETFLRRVLAAAGAEPRVVITDKLASYPPALSRVLPNTEHRRHKGFKNRAENSHQPRGNVSAPCDGSSRRSKRSAFSDRSEL